ncbi:MULTISPECIES: hypothetical protein [unclassified Microcoleus]|uniref:hypothetical protein n=1 Tax=unclassified Microcoleus TaxID=2642155 RepID=UPI002FCEF9BF
MFEEKEFNGGNEKAAVTVFSTAFEANHIASYSQLWLAAVIFIIFFENIWFSGLISNPVLLPIFWSAGSERKLTAVPAVFF